MQPAVTVGLDGSRASLTAAHWAAEEARLRDVPLRLVHAWALLHEEAMGSPGEELQDHWSKRIVREAAQELRKHHPGLPISEELVARDPVDALLAESGRSHVLALGSRGLGTLAHFFLGDVALDVVGRAEGPVVLVRAPEHEAGLEATPTHGITTASSTAHAPGDEGEIVVGVRLDHPGDGVLQFALDTAVRRGAPVRVVHATTRPSHAYAPWGVDAAAAKDLVDTVRRELRGVLAPWRERHPQTEIAEQVDLDSPARALVRAAEGARMVITGRRRKGPVLAPRLGAVVHAVIHHARCPVAVVPHD